MALKRKGARIKSDAELFGKDKQDRVMAYYKKIGAVTDKSSEEALHMFFSPNRIPIGMTKDEAHQCVVLYPVRQWHYNRWAPTNRDPMATMMGRPLPDELRCLKITSAQFIIGINKFKADIAMLLLSDIAGHQTLGDNKTGQTVVDQLISVLPFPSDRINRQGGKNFCQPPKGIQSLKGILALKK